MSVKHEEEIRKYPELKQYLSTIPQDLWEVLLPSDSKDFAAFSSAIKSLRIKEKERDYIIELRAKYGLPFRPNASIDETIKRVRLIRWKRKMQAGGEASEPGAENSSADRNDPDEEMI